MTQTSDSESGETVGSQMVSGAAWLISGNLVSRVLGFISIIVLTRYLAPNDFGLIAMAVSVLSLLEALSGFGFQSYLIQNQDADDAHYNTVWTLTVIRAIAIAALLAIVAIPAAVFWRDPRIEGLMYFYAVAALFMGITNVGIVDLLKDMNFRRNFIFRVGARFGGFAVGVVLAVVLQNYWAIALAALAHQILSVVMSYILHPFRPRFSLSAMKEIWAFSSWVLVRSVVAFTGRRADRILLGRMIGLDAAGLYDVANEASSIPTSELVLVIGEAIVPGFARLAGKPKEFAATYVKSISIILSLSVPAGLGMMLIADPFVMVVLTPEFAPAIPVIQILAIYGILSTGLGNLHGVYMAVGQARRSAFFQFVETGVRLPILVAGIVYWGMIGAAWAMVISGAISLLYGLWLIVRHFGVLLPAIGQNIWRVVLSAGVMVVCVRVATDLLAASAPEWHLVAGVLVGVLSYGGALMLLWRLSGCPMGPERTLVDWLVARTKTAGA
jgi:lipopolysaccharide exporter